MRYTLTLACLLVVSPAAAESLLLELGWENQLQQLPAVYAFSVANPGGIESAGLWEEQVTNYPYTSFASAEIVEQFNYAIGFFPWHAAFDGYYPIVEMVILDKFINSGGRVLQGPERPALCTSCYWRRLVTNAGDEWRTGPEWAAFAESVGWNVNLQVPLLGQGLRGYEVTSIQRTVTADQQTIRLFGKPGGDFNHDGSIDAADYVVWRKSGDSSVGHLVWKMNYGAGGSQAAAIPEPASWLFALALCWRIRHRR